jgi:protein gp37
MNKTKIETFDYTWNPITGCHHKCHYCYARKIAERFRGSKAWPNGFEPTFHPDRLNDPFKMKNSQTIFVCSMADLFGDWVPDKWISDVFEACLKAPQHTYCFLTKNPQRYFKLGGNILQQKNFWFGTTETGEILFEPHLSALLTLPAENRFVSFEPLLHKVDHTNLSGINQIIIGSQTNPTVVPPEGSVINIVREAKEKNIPIFLKESMDSINWTGMSHFTNVHELAWGLHK